MRKLALVVTAALLIASNAIAGNTTSLNAKALAKTILNMHKLTSSNKGSFAIVYGGQDISRSSFSQTSRVGNPVLVG